jgi:uncharacterized protein DUF4386
MTRRKIAVTVGILFIAQMVTAIIGTSLIQAFEDGDTARGPVTVGVLFMLSSGLSVAAIGVLMYQVLKVVNPKLALMYPILRVIELTVSTACGAYLLMQLEVVPNHMLWIYIPTAAGGVVLSYLLLISRLVPRPIALLGLVGYLALGAGVPLEFAGVLDMDNGVGRALLAPGGVFEFVLMPVWLILNGFRPVVVEQQRELAGAAGLVRGELVTNS